MWIREAAEAAGVNVETLRYYERRGLLAQPERPAQGYRNYSQETVQVVLFIKQAQDLGFTLEDIDELLRLQGRTIRGRERARVVAEQKLEELDRKMAQLRDMRTRLQGLIAACRAGSSRECPILEAIGAGAVAERRTNRASQQVLPTRHERTVTRTRRPARDQKNRRKRT